ncbi:CbiX/SirB N-terminal domain-containing protein [Stagnihabitans tardus]|uniref:Cobalamin biosynthesis protein CbiX n=1 Tax=Stagnihabitans tardus TaxID=2699202 RepID=A0AAE5BUV6_9RHOB|nr:CbiX/SirB N-terminal domain-containing protein [Stagnihabitans tardus]NBZ88296.1 cobalamin biosynthesis protein CbiX [Stagnihabitans tardus]
MKALLVAHGQPSDPEPAQAALGELACQVAGHLPGWDIRFATLALPGALARAVDPEPGYVYPMFMAGGWFTKTELPRRMAEVGADWQHLAPFGLAEEVQDLAVTLATEAAARLGQSPATTPVLIAAHGSGRSRAPAEVAESLAARLCAAGFTRAEAYFIEEAPFIASAQGFGPGALCLPFFAAEGGHVTDDLPEALQEAGFQGLCLPPLGLDPRVPALIAAALRRSASKA